MTVEELDQLCVSLATAVDGLEEAVALRPLVKLYDALDVATEELHRAVYARGVALGAIPYDWAVAA